jgi:DNA-binding MarR family transcriptional regulator
MRQHHSVSTLITRMANMGLVDKAKSLEDKRYRIAVTKLGREQCRKVTMASLAMTFSILSSTQKKQLSDTLIQLLEKARYLLGMAQMPPFIRLLNDKKESEADLPVLSSKSQIDYDLWSLLDRVGFAMTRLRDLELTQLGLTAPQSSILYAIQQHNGEMTLQELEDHRMRQHHSIFILINRMIKMGLIRQIKTPGDRKYKIVITPEGEEIFKKITTKSLEMTFGTLSEQEQQKLVEYLNPILERARYLLGVSYVPPFLQYLIYGESAEKEQAEP